MGLDVGIAFLAKALAYFTHASVLAGFREFEGALKKWLSIEGHNPTTHNAPGGVAGGARRDWRRLLSA